MSRSFDGSGDRLVYTGVVVDTPPFTMATWFKRGAISTTQYLLNACTQGSTNHSHRLVFTSANSFTATSTDTLTSNSSGHTLTDTASWHHGAGVWASTTSRRCYLDGTADTVNTTSRTPSGIDRFKVGAGGAEGQVLNGLVAHAAVWSAALTANEIAMLAAGLSPLMIRPQSLVAYWPYLGRDATEIDIVGLHGLAVTGAGASADERWLYRPSRKRVIYVPVGANAYTLTAGQGAYSLSGQAAGLQASRLLTAAQGSYSLTGQDAALRKTYLLIAEQGSYSLNGQSAGLVVTRVLAADQGSYALNGQSANLVYGKVLTAAQGTYSLSGQAVNLFAARRLTAAQGSYALTGQAATLVIARRLAAAQGAYSLTGLAAGLIYSGSGPVLLAGMGAYALSGQPVTLRRTSVLTAEPGGYLLTGQAALLHHGLQVAAESAEYTGGWARYLRAEQEAARYARFRTLAEEAAEARERETLAARLEAVLMAEGTLAQGAVERLQFEQIAALYADRALLDRRAQRALAYAERAQSELAIHLALRELQRQQADEELALVLVLAAD